MPLLSAAEITEICESILVAAEVPKEQAKLTAQHFTTTNLAGHDSHGIQNFPRIVKLILKGSINPKGEWKIVKETPAIALIDGDQSLGQVVVTGALEVVMKKAKSVGIGAASIFNCTHIGRLGDYTTKIAEQGMIGMIYANSPPAVAPYGGKTRVLGTNPLSCAFPTDGRPIMVDFATSVVAEGKVRAAQNKGLPIPQGWIIDKDGKPSTIPSDLYPTPNVPNSAGALLPLGLYKGYGLSIAVDILSGALSGSGVAGEIKTGNGVYLQAINIESFSSMKDYKGHVKNLVLMLKHAPVGNGFNEILLPGEPEIRSTKERLERGINVPEPTWQEIIEVAKELHVDLPVPKENVAVNESGPDHKLASPFGWAV